MCAGYSRPLSKSGETAQRFRERQEQAMQSMRIISGKQPFREKVISGQRPVKPRIGLGQKTDRIRKTCGLGERHLLGVVRTAKRLPAALQAHVTFPLLKLPCSRAIQLTR